MHRYSSPVEGVSRLQSLDFQLKTPLINYGTTVSYCGKCFERIVMTIERFRLLAAVPNTGANVIAMWRLQQ